MRFADVTPILIDFTAAPRRRIVESIDVAGTPSAPLETTTFLDAFLPSLMPRTSTHQGLAAGLNVLTARAATAVVEAVHQSALGSRPGIGRRLVLRSAEAAVGHALASVPEQENETLWRAGARTGGQVVRAAAVGGAVYDLAQQYRYRGLGARIGVPWLGGAMITLGATYWASRRLAVRKETIQRWPVVQEATLPAAVGTGMAISAAGSVLAGAYRLTGRGLQHYFGDGPTKRVLAGATNAAAWAGGVSAAYNAGIASIGRANEKVEPAYATPPHSRLVSGSPESLLPYDELGMQGRRYVTDVVTPELIEEVLQEPAVDHPIRAYVGFNTQPLYSTGRAELALEELERTGAFDRSYLLLVSPTGTGWVDQTVVEAAEFLARGDIATCSIQYGRFPSFLCIQKVGLGRIQFRLLLWGIAQRLAERPPERRPKVLVFGESLGAWTSSDVVMSQGIAGFDHYGIDRALWFGLPALAKWSRNGMATGSGNLVPDGTVGVFDNHDELAALDDEQRARLRAVVLSHDNDPIAALRPELMIQQPDWLGEERGRNVPEGMDWIPLVTFWQVAVDAANAMVTVPGDFRSFGHDYRGDTTRFVRDGFALPDTDEAQTARIDEALIRLDVERKARIKARAEEDAPLAPAARLPEARFHGGVPLQQRRAKGARWLTPRSGAASADRAGRAAAPTA